MVFGWTVAVSLTSALAWQADCLAESGLFRSYSMAVLTVSSFYTISDVSGSGLLVEMNRLQPESHRGSLIVAAQACRSLAALVAGALGILALHDDGEMLLPFQPSLGQVHGALAACALSLFLPLVACLRDAEERREQRGSEGALSSLWSALQTKAAFSLVLMSLLYVAVASMPNPTTDIVMDLMPPSAMQHSVQSAGRTVLAIVGTCLGRLAVSRNWRMAYTMALLLKFLLCGTVVMVMQNAWEVGQRDWFHEAVNVLPHAVHGFVRVLTHLVVAELAPVGWEATACELVATLQRAAAVLGVGLEKGLGTILAFEEALEGAGSPEHLSGPLAGATYMTLGVHLAGAGLTVVLMPSRRRVCRDWLADVRWRHPRVAFWTLGLAAVAISASLVMLSFGLAPQRSCLDVAGGSGC